MNPRTGTFRIAVRKFGPFESAIQKQWASFCSSTGCRLLAASTRRPWTCTRCTRRSSRQRRATQERRLGRGLRGHGLGGRGRGGGRPPRPCPAPARPTARPATRRRSGPSPCCATRGSAGCGSSGCPITTAPSASVYRSDLFADRRGPCPAPDPWEEFHACARRLTAPAEKRWGTVFAAFPDGHNTVYDFCLQLWTRGGELFDGDGRPVLDSPQAKEALEYYRRIVNDRSAVHPRSREFDSVQERGFSFAHGRGRDDWW